MSLLWVTLRQVFLFMVNYVLLRGLPRSHVQFENIPDFFIFGPFCYKISLGSSLIFSTCRKAVGQINKKLLDNFVFALRPLRTGLCAHMDDVLQHIHLHEYGLVDTFNDIGREHRLVIGLDPVSSICIPPRTPGGCHLVPRPQPSSPQWW